MYVGTFTVRTGRGIYGFHFDARSGDLTPLGCVAEAGNPSSIVIDPTGRYLYAVGNCSNHRNQNSGAVRAFAIDHRTGKLAHLNEVSSGGPCPCHIAIDKTGSHVLVANYDGGSIALLPVLADGRLAEEVTLVQHHGASVDRERQHGPHPHAIELSPDNRFAIAADLGLDQLLVYRFDPAHSSLEANCPAFIQAAPGCGPRHLAFHPGGRFLYVVSEMGSSVIAYAYEAGRGVLHEIQTVSSLPDGFAGSNSGAEIEIHPAGRFLYASNRGHDSIVAFSINRENGMLTLLDFFPTRGRTPRTFAIDLTASYLIVANEDSDTVLLFQIDPNSGRLAPTGRVLPVPSPASIRFVRVE